jgi:hypothetical protein
MIVTFIALIGWIPLALMLFAVLPARRAMVVGAVAAWLLLPPVAIDLQGLPPLSKATVTAVGILLGTLVFDVSRFLAFRPRWFDLPMLLFCLCPYATAISNGLRSYEGMSAALVEIVAWLFPYLVGDHPPRTASANWPATRRSLLDPLLFLGNEDRLPIAEADLRRRRLRGGRYGFYPPSLQRARLGCG